VTNVHEYKLPTRIESVDDAALNAEQFARAKGFGDDVVSAIDLAVRESVANAVKHGNKFDETKSVELRLAKVEEGLEISVRDYGAGFDVEEIPDPTDAANLLKANGRGILFMRSFMDEVEWSAAPGGGMIVKMLKRV
jgi:serine/threonine-protein kinase RsbW